jgi:hypothetical protein
MGKLLIFSVWSTIKKGFEDPRSTGDSRRKFVLATEFCLTLKINAACSTSLSELLRFRRKILESGKEKVRGASRAEFCLSHGI